MTLLLGFLLVLDGPLYERPDKNLEMSDLKRQIEKATVDQAFWIQRIKLYTEIGELKDQVGLIELLVAACPGVPQFQEAQMLQLALNDDTQAAIRWGEAACTQFPDYPTLRSNLARIYLKNGDRARGINLMLTAIERAPVRVEDWDILLRAMGLGSIPPDQFIQQLREKIEKNPQITSLKYTLLLALTRFGRYQEARELLIENNQLAQHPDLHVFLYGFQTKSESPQDVQ